MSLGARTVAADTVALTAFVVAGSVTHHDGIPTAAVTLGILLCCWFGVGRLLPRVTTVAVWIVSIPLFVALRAVALGRPFDRREATFGAVALVFTGLFVTAGRLVSRRILPGPPT